VDDKLGLSIILRNGVRAYAEGISEWGVAEWGYRIRRDEGLPFKIKRSSVIRPDPEADPSTERIEDRWLEVDALSNVVILNRVFIPGDRLQLEGNKMAAYFHIDDCLFMGDKGAPTARAGLQSANILRSLGFVIPEVVTGDAIEKFVGMKPHSSTASWYPVPEKAALIYDSISWLLSGRYVVGVVVLRILYYWLWFSLLEVVFVHTLFYI